MKTLIASVLFLVASSSYAAGSFQLVCDASTDEHPALTLTINPVKMIAEILVEANDGSSQTWVSTLKSSTTRQLQGSLMTDTAVLVGVGKSSFISGNRDFFSDAVSVVLKQKTAGLTGAQTAILTLDNTVTIHTCSKK